MKFINRQKEMQRLDRLASSSESAIAIVWGRRRLGKTRLLVEWAHKHNGVYFTADESTPSIQRKYFSLTLEKVLPGFSSVNYPDWISFLNRLAKDAFHAKWRGPIVIDELPYLIAVSPELPSVLQRFIDHEAKQAKLLIALCGSSQRMMQGAVLDSSSPLYGRAQEMIKLGPISVGYMEEALGITDPKDIIESYGIWGGIPRYWELAAGTAVPLIECIDNLVLDPMGPLHDEPNHLLMEELPSAVILRPILDAIGLGAHRLTEIAARIGQPITSLSRQIQRLIELDLIEKEIPFGTQEHNTKKVLYKIKDPFVRFWFEVVAPRRSFFIQANSENRKKILKDSLTRLFAITWEELCRLSAPLLIQQWNGVIYGPASRYWHGKGPEWDVLAESIDRHSLLIGESKWITKIPSSSWIEKTIEEIKGKGLPPVTQSHNPERYYVLFIPEKPKQQMPISNAKIVDAEEIIRILRF